MSFNKNKNFGDGNKFGGKKSFGGDRDRKGGFGGGRDGGRPQMHRATCSDCGNSCEVPFRPTGDKPVFCSNCFGNKKEGGFRDGGRKDFGNRDSRPSFGDKRPHQGGGSNENLKAQIDQLNYKLDKILKLLNPGVSVEIDKAKELKQKEEKKADKKDVDTKALGEIIEKAVGNKTSKAKKEKKTEKKSSPKQKLDKPAKKASPKKPTKEKKVMKKKK